MKKLILSTLLFIAAVHVSAQDTFSIVAVDSTTGEVGSAGASCLEAPNPPTGCLIISDVVPGKGAIHTQAQWNQYNQVNADGYMKMGYSPKDILYHVNLDDFDSDSTIRQYGVALFDTFGHVQTGGYTGVNCFDYKNHIAGAYYCVQGNILMGQQILDSIETRFLHTHGSLADRLMAALQGANVPGADTRCLAEGIPAESSFLRVAKPTDSPDTLYLDLRVISRPYGMSPIDSLQTLYNSWKSDQPSAIHEVGTDIIRVFPNPSSEACTLQFGNSMERKVDVFDVLGNLVFEKKCFAFCLLRTDTWQKGIYYVRSGYSTVKLIVQ